MPAPDTPEEQVGIDFHSEQIEFDLERPEEVAAWIEAVIEQEEHVLLQLNFIFCSDDYLHAINVEYLQHDTLTDIITFPYSSPPQIEGDLFISIDRVRENALEFEVPFHHELLRVMIHGVLHLCGYGDKSPDEVRAMRAKEEEKLRMILSA